MSKITVTLINPFISSSVQAGVLKGFSGKSYGTHRWSPVDNAHKSGPFTVQEYEAMAMDLGKNMDLIQNRWIVRLAVIEQPALAAPAPDFTQTPAPPEGGLMAKDEGPPTPAGQKQATTTETKPIVWPDNLSPASEFISLRRKAVALGCDLTGVHGKPAVLAILEAKLREQQQ